MTGASGDGSMMPGERIPALGPSWFAAIGQARPIIEDRRISTTAAGPTVVRDLTQREYAVRSLRWK
jgi:hypothetical protein